MLMGFVDNRRLELKGVISNAEQGSRIQSNFLAGDGGDLCNFHARPLIRKAEEHVFERRFAYG